MGRRTGVRLAPRSSTTLVVIAVLGLAVLLADAVRPRLASAQNELFVADSANNAVTVYARTAAGNVGPIRFLNGAATGLSGPVALGVDTVNNELVVGNFGNESITVYGLTT